MIAMALACEPKLLIADEPTTALDVTIQAQILDLIRELQVRLKLAVILVTHDLGVVAQYADDVTILYAARVMEQAPSAELFTNPLNPYTRGLLESIPGVDGHRHHRLQAIPGTIPNALHPPSGCRFHPRCPMAIDECARVDPPLESKSPATSVSPASVSNPVSNLAPSEDRTAAVSAAPGALVRTERLSKEFPAGSLDLLGAQAPGGARRSTASTWRSCRARRLAWSASRGRASRHWGV